MVIYKLFPSSKRRDTNLLERTQPSLEHNLVESAYVAELQGFGSSLRNQEPLKCSQHRSSPASNLSVETSPYLCPPPHGLQRGRLVPKWRHLWLNLCFLVGRKNEISLVLDNIFTKDGYPINPRVSSYLLRLKTCTKVTYFEYPV